MKFSVVIFWDKFLECVPYSPYLNALLCGDNVFLMIPKAGKQRQDLSKSYCHQQTVANEGTQDSQIFLFSLFQELSITAVFPNPP